MTINCQVKPRDKWLTTISQCIIFVGFLLNVWFIWSVVVGDPVITKIEPIRLYSSKVIKGGEVEYSISFCKDRDVIADIYEFLKDDKSQIWAERNEKGISPIGCHSKERKFLLPMEVPAGHYYIEQIIEYPLNPFKTEVIRVKTPEFDIID